MLELITQLFKEMPRQSPGSDAMSRLAFSFVPELPRDAVILDIGCGNGAQTLVLADCTNDIRAKIFAIDLIPDFLDVLMRKARMLGCEDRIVAETVSMEELPYPENSFDLIWAEGSIYNIGFEKGIASWHKYLKPGAFIAVSEVCWTTGKRPKEIEDYWYPLYDEIETVSEKIARLEANDYTTKAVFAFPNECWTNNYYIPLLDRSGEFLRLHGSTPGAAELIEENRREAEQFDRFGDYYSYFFFVAQKLVKAGSENA